MLRNNRQTGGLIIEGVTGAGKSSTLAVLRGTSSRLGPLSFMKFIDEDVVLGDVMEQFHDPRIGAKRKWAPLFRLLEHIRRKPSSYLLERFHPTFYALIPDRGLFDAVDAEMKDLGYRVVFLHYDEAVLPRRGLNREDRAGSGWIEGMKDFYGGEKPALAAIAASQKRRFECLAKSRLPVLEIDTTQMRWRDYADRIAAFARG